MNKVGGGGGASAGHDGEEGGEQAGVPEKEITNTVSGAGHSVTPTEARNRMDENFGDPTKA